MVKMGLVASIKPSESYSTQHGTFYPMWVNFTNGDSGLYTSKSANQTKFVVGSEAAYQLEEKTAKSGKTYFKLKPDNIEFARSVGASPNGSSNGFSGSSTTQEEIVRQTCLMAASTVANNAEQALNAALIFADWVGVAKDKSQSIIRQSCLKSASAVSATSKEKVLEVAEKFLAFVNDSQEAVTPAQHMAGRETPAPVVEEVVEDGLPF